MEQPLAGQVAILTGADRGIGPRRSLPAPLGRSALGRFDVDGAAARWGLGGLSGDTDEFLIDNLILLYHTTARLAGISLTSPRARGLRAFRAGRGKAHTPLARHGGRRYRRAREHRRVELRGPQRAHTCHVTATVLQN